MKRNCPKCKREIIYKHPISYKKSIKENRPCIKCTRKEVSNRPEEILKNSERGKIQCSGRGNPFFGKKHSKESIKKILENGTFLSGTEAPMYGKTIYSVWLKKFGKEIADEKLIDFKKKISISSSGERNGMYGKPSPQGSGNGWSGWYKGWFFRSLLELSYVINIERFNFKWKSAETIKIKYVNWEGKSRNYFPDFLVGEKYLIECKPKKLFQSADVLLKKKAAEEYCLSNGLTYKLICPLKITIDKLIVLHKSNLIQFTDKYEKRFKENFSC